MTIMNSHPEKTKNVVKELDLGIFRSLKGLSIKILTAVPMEELRPGGTAESRRLFDHMKINGVYFLQEGQSSGESFEPYGEQIIYIGKASGKTQNILQRCRKHYSSLLDLKTNSGQPKERPGRGLKNIRMRRESTVEGILAFPALVISDEKNVSLGYNPYLISLTEEFLLYEYRQRNGGRLPEGNVKR